jgi:hypothetical protein
MACQPGKVIMIVNEFENSKEYRLQQIIHTLESIHGVKLDLDSQSVDELRTLGESCEIIKNSIVHESAFNTAMQNPEYTKNMLMMEAIKIYLAEIAPKRMSKKKAVKEAVDPAKMVKIADFGRKMMDYSQGQQTTDEKELRILNAISQVGDKLTQLGTPFGPTTLTDMDKRVIEVARRRMSTQSVAETVPGQELKLQPGMVKVQKDNGPEEVIATKDLENKQRQGFQPVAEDDELAMLYKKYGLEENGMDEATDQDGDGDNDFADVMIARMTKSGMNKGAAIAKTAHKPYNKESMMEAAGTKEFHKLTKKKKELEDKMDKIVKDGGKMLRTDPLRKDYEAVCADIKKMKSAKLEEAAHMEHHDDYQADMARSELYRNTKYAMDMMKMIGPDDAVTPWIAASLTKAAGVLDKVYHYMDYNQTFQEPAEPAVSSEPVMPVDEEEDMIPGDAGSIARENLLQIMEYSTKLFRMIRPGDKLEGWVAMKLTSASESISSSKHHLDYVQFEKHVGQPGVDVDSVPVEEIKESSIANILIGVMLNEDQDLAQAETLLAAKSMSDDLQGIAEKLAKMGVDDLMPLVDTMKEQFGQDAANGFNDTIKAVIEAALTSVTEAKDVADNAILAMQQGQVPGVAADIGSAELPGEMPDAGEEEFDDELGATPAASGEETEPLGRAKKEEAPEELEEAWDAKMKTAKKDIGKWEGYTVAQLKAKKKKLMDKESRSAAEQKEVKQIDFALRAKSGWGKVDEAKKAKPDFLDLDKDGNKKESMKKAAADKKKAGKVDESNKMKQDYIDAAGEQLPGLKKAGWKTRDMSEKPGKKAEKARATANKRIAGMTKAAMTMKEENVSEVAPPGKKAEDFIKGAKEDFKKRYGKDWESKLYATAWKKFGPKKESIEKMTAMLESAKDKRASLVKVLEAHKAKFAKMVNEGITKDPLKAGYGLEGETILDQISETDTLISKIKEMIRAEIKTGITELTVSENAREQAEKLAESKSKAPFGILWKDAANKKQQKFFESEDLRALWVDLNKESIVEHKLINPADFDKKIESLTAKKG